MSIQTTKSTCSYCGVGCGVVINFDTDTQVITLRGDDEHPVNKGMLCAKGMNLHHAVMDTTDRLTTPMMRNHRQLPLQAVSWEDALTRTAAVFQSLIKKFGADSVGFYVSGQLLTEEYYIVNKLVKGFIGTNNIDTNSRLCMSSAVVAYKKSLGEDIVPVCYDDIEHADCIVMAGANPAWCHPILFRRMSAMKQNNPSIKWIVIDPRQTQSTQMADIHLQIIPGTDIYVFHAIARYLIEQGKIDRAYIDAHVNGFDELQKHVMRMSMEDYAQAAGVAVTDIIQVSEWIGDAKGFLSLWTMGLNQSAIGVNKNLALINLSLITGKIGRVGNGPFSLTGQPNAMGGREVGGLANMLAVHKDITNSEHRAQIADFWHVPTEQISPNLGLTATEMIAGLESGKLKAIWVICTNPIVSLPDARRVEAALRNANFVIVQDISKNAATIDYADVVLPAAGYMEKTGTMTNAERRVSLVQKIIEPVGQALPDAQILQRFAHKMGWKSAFNFADYEAIYEEYKLQTVGTNLDVSGITYELLRKEGTVQWPYPHSGIISGNKRLCQNGQFFTPDKKANLFAVECADESEPLTEQFPLVLTTGRIRDQWHTMTRTGKVQTLKQHLNEPYIDIHPHDAQTRAINEGDLVDVTGARGTVRLRAQITERIRAGVVFLPMHWGREINWTSNEAQTPTHVWDKHDAARANNLTEMRVDPMSKQPNFKYSVVEVKRVMQIKKKIIVIGAGAGATQFVQQYQALNPLAHIEVFSKEANPFYNRIMLPDYLSGHKDWQALQLLEHETRVHLRAKVHQGISIEQIQPKIRQVIDSQGIAHTYDELIVATGSRSFVPDNFPTKARNFFTVRQREDIDGMREFLHRPTRVAIIGGGLLGLEMADALHQLGHTVEVIQIADRLMSRQLDALSADLLKELLIIKGIHITLNDEVVEFMQTDGIITHTRLKSGRVSEVSLVLGAIGTRANTEILQAAGVRCARGVLVNSRLQTSEPHIHAIGEIAELNGETWGISSAAVEQANVLARVLAGDPHARYTGSVSMNILKLQDIQLASIGMVDVPQHNAHEYQVVRMEDIACRYYKKCIVHKNKLVGAIMLGNKDEFNQFRQLIADKQELGDARETLLRPNGNTRPAIQGKLVCACNSVGDGNIRACMTNGANTLDKIMAETGAGTGCGSCKPELQGLLKLMADTQTKELAL